MEFRNFELKAFQFDLFEIGEKEKNLPCCERLTFSSPFSASPVAESYHTISSEIFCAEKMKFENFIRFILV